MKKNIYLYLLGAIVLGGIIWFATQKAPNSPSTADTTPTTNESSLRSLLATPMPQQCTFESADSSGTVYIAGSQMSGDFTSSISGQSQLAHTIIKNNQMYLWMDGEAEGMIMDIPAEDTKANSSTTASSAFDLDENVKYDCKSWTVVQSKFQTPSNVKFSDLSEMMKSLPVAPSGASTMDLKQYGL